MHINKSQRLIIETIGSAVLGLPDINKIFTEEIINFTLNNPMPFLVPLISVLKILLVIGSIYWLIQLIQNIEITYRTKSPNIFQNYIMKLIITGFLTLIATCLIKLRFNI